MQETRGGDIMPDKLFLQAEDIMEIMGIARSTAHKLIRDLNSELRKNGYITIQGKVPTKYYFERFGLVSAGTTQGGQTR